jgi:hypothetical protein
LRGLHLATGQRPGFKDLLVPHCRFPVGLSHRLLRLQGLGVPIGVFSLPHGDYLQLKSISQRETGRHIDPVGQTCFPTS